MNEPKAFELKVGKNLETDSPIVVGVDNKWNSRIMSCEEVYLKSEADKVIAELKDDVAYWKKIAKKNMDDNVAMAKQRADAFKRERHHKYKRCLAMASSCSDKASAEYASSYVSCDEYYYHHAEFWVKWHKRWLKLAEKFK